jgi:hypothetical protein
MQYDPRFTLVGITIALIASFAAISGWIAHIKRRPPLEGVLLGLFLGPIGLLIEWRAPFLQRPMVDQKAWNSLRSMLVYQEAGREFNREKKREKNRSENRTI